MPDWIYCPICQSVCRWEGNPVRPFCSERCRLLDLHNWMDERYRIPGAPAADESEHAGDSDDE